MSEQDDSRHEDEREADAEAEAPRGLGDRPDPRLRPPDPAGTRPKFDPGELLPRTSEPLLSSSAAPVIDTQAVEEGGGNGGDDDGGEDLLPARREGGGAVAEPVAAGESRYAPRFHFITGALVAVAAAAIVVVVAIAISPGTGSRGGGDDDGWSVWRPAAEGADGAREIAGFVAPRYKLPDGRQIVEVTADPMEIDGVPLDVAVRESADQGGEIRVFEDDGIIYRLCGLGPDCAIKAGKPSRERHLLLRREALEMALYTFRYLEKVNQVIVFMPPPLGDKPTQALFFRRGDVGGELERPLGDSLESRVPTVRNVTLSPDAILVDQLTSPKIFKFSLTQANTDNRGYIVLEPFDATTTDAQPQEESGSPGSGSGSESSASRASGQSTTSQ